MRHDNTPDGPRRLTPQTPHGTLVSRRTVIRASAALGASVGVLGTAQVAHADGHSGGRRLLLARAGRTTYTVYVGADEGPVVRHAAREIAEYLSAITGASFPLVESSEAPSSTDLIVVGRHNPVAAAVDLPLAELSDDGFCLRTVNPSSPTRDGSSVLIAGESERGSLYGAYWFLDRLCGVRWFSPDFTVVPRTRVLGIRQGDLNAVKVARFRFREVFAAEGVDPAFRHHNLLNGSSHHLRERPTPPELDTWSDFWPYEAHNFHDIVPDQSLWHGGHLLVMDPATREQASAELIERIQTKAAAGRDPSYGFSQMDWPWQADAESAAFAEAHGGALSAPIIDMVNEVAEEVGQVIPEARLATLAYKHTFRPPTGLAVSDRVVITAAPIWADFAHPLLSEANAETAADLDGWTQLTDQIVVWTYNTNFENYLLPFPNWWTMCESLQQLADRSVQGYFGQAAWDNGGGAETAELRAWVLARLLWEPELDPDALIREFVDNYYGAAGSRVYSYLKLLADSVESTGAELSCYISSVAPEYLPFETVRQADDLLADAERKARRDATVLKHVRILRMGLDMVILLRRYELARTAAERGVSWDMDIDRRIIRFNEALDASGMTAFREILAGAALGDIGWLRRLVSIRPTPAEPPIEVASLPAGDWVDYQELEFNLYPLNTDVVEDPAASSGYAARMTGSSGDWGVQLELYLLPPEVTWKIYVVVRADTQSQNPADRAMSIGVHPPAHNFIDLTVGDFSDGEYHTIEVPGTYRSDSAEIVWVQPPHSGAISHLYVDRMFAVRA